MISDKHQGRRIYFDYFNTHLLCFKTVRITVECYRHGTHYLVSHLLCLKVIRDKCKGVQFYVHCFVAHLLRLKMIGDVSQLPCQDVKKSQLPWTIINFLIAHLLRIKIPEDLFYPARNTLIQGHIYWCLWDGQVSKSFGTEKKMIHSGMCRWS